MRIYLTSLALLLWAILPVSAQQYVRPAQAYPATTSQVANQASTSLVDTRNFLNQAAQKLGPQIGTTTLGTIKTIGSNQSFVFSNAVYAALVAAGVDFSGAQYNSSTAEGTYTASSAVSAFALQAPWRQICLAIGDSLTDSTAGSTAYPPLTLTQNQLGQMGTVGTSGFHVGYGGYSTFLAPSFSYTFETTTNLSRIVMNLGHPGWRYNNQTGYTYSQGSPQLDNAERFSNIQVAPGQQVIFYNFAGTNDVVYSFQNSNAGMGSVPQGTAGYTYNTYAVDFFTNALLPMLAKEKALYPTTKRVVQLPVARGTDAQTNGTFNEIALYILANKSQWPTWGIDMFVDSRQAPPFDARSPTVTNNRTYYQNDNTHLTPAGYAYWAPIRAAVYDYFGGVGLPSTYTSSGLIVTPYLLRRDVDPASNDNSPVFLGKAA